MTDSISGTPFSLQFVLAKLQEAGVNNRCLQQNLVNFDVEDITNGAAFMSHIFKLNLHWNMTTATELFKEVSDSDLHDAELKKAQEEHPDNAEEFLTLAHSREILFYQLFPTYEKTLKLPKFYYGFEFSEKHTDGLIIMEDLTPKATTIKMLPGMNDEQVLSMMDELARIHTVSWKHPDWMTQLVNLERSEEFMCFTRTVTESLKQLKPEWFAELVDQLLPIFTTDILENVVYDTDRFGFPPAAVHGDLWASNIMQPCEDIARLLSLNTTGIYRRANTQRLLKRYTDKVTEFMDGKALFTLQTIEQAYEEAMPYVATYTGFGAPMYYNMPSVVGHGAEKAANQLELLSRVHMFFQDTLTVINKHNKTQ
uniref:CHK kinase-like domain-containing protein n=1 Tax=Ditylenchus dipsaci TaxID=166011 RepID=A0A915CR22_9BILA